VAVRSFEITNWDDFLLRSLRALNPLQTNPIDSFEIVTVASGARSLRSLNHGETFHPVVGPMAEARGLHVAQQRMTERARGYGADPFVVWDVGLGAAANALAVVEAFSGITSPVELHSFDRTIKPLEFALHHASELGYFASHERDGGNVVARLGGPLRKTDVAPACRRLSRTSE
jgi:hypothetical protein